MITSEPSEEAPSVAAVYGGACTDQESNGLRADDSPQGDTVCRRLLAELRAGRLHPGERLRETALARRLGVSRTPVREAIRQLEADGLVVHLPRQGASVRRLDHGEVMELYEMRMVLEGTAARLAARAASEPELAELAAINAHMARAARSDNGHEAVRLNDLFHGLLLAAARNRFLQRSMRSLDNSLLILGTTTLADSGRIEDAHGEHQAVLEALTARDGTSAEARMRSHIETAWRVRLRSRRKVATPTDAP